MGMGAPWLVILSAMRRESEVSDGKGSTGWDQPEALGTADADTRGGAA